MLINLVVFNLYIYHIQVLVIVKYKGDEPPKKLALMKQQRITAYYCKRLIKLQGNWNYRVISSRSKQLYYQLECTCGIIIFTIMQSVQYYITS